MSHIQSQVVQAKPTFKLYNILYSDMCDRKLVEFSFYSAKLLYYITKNVLV